MLWKFFSAHWRDIAIALALFACALALRLPNLALVPPLWDSEAAEALDALDIASGRTLPLALPSQPHLGVVAAYPLALLLRVFGVSPFAPRMFVAVCGALTVVATFWLARVWGSRPAGAVAGLLLAVNPFHIVINSHVFWTNSITPLLTTLALAALSIAVERFAIGTRAQRVWWLGALVLFGFALQSHPSVIALAPGIALWLVARRDVRARARDAWTYVGAGGALLAYANMIVFNFSNGFRSLEVASAKSYALPEESAVVGGYTDRLHDLLNELFRLLTATTQPDVPLTVLNLIVSLWFAAALVLALKTTRGLLWWTTLCAALIIAYSNKVYGAGYAERYIMFLLPMAFAAMGLALDAVWGWLRARNISRTRVVALAALVVLGWYGVNAWLTLDGYYRTEIAQGRSNESYLAWNEIALPYARDGYRVLIGTRLDNEFVVQFGSTYGVVMGYLLRMQGYAPRFAAREDVPHLLEAEPTTRSLLLLARQGEFSLLRTQLPLCVISGLQGRVMAIYKGGACP